MDIDRYIEDIRRQLEVAAEAGGEDSRALAQRLFAPLESATRLAILDALGAAAEEITLEMAPSSVELRLRGGEPAFVVNLPSEISGDEGGVEADAPPGWRPSASTEDAGGEGSIVARINLRLPDQIKAQVEQAASKEGLSLNSWLVRATAAALDRKLQARAHSRSARGSQHYTGWAR